MAIGFPASYRQTVHLPDDIPDPRPAVLQAASDLKWRVFADEPGKICMAIDMTFTNNGEHITVFFNQTGFFTIESRCALAFQLLDWGKNKRNVNRFLQAFRSLSYSRPA